MKLTFTNEDLKRLWANAEAHWPNGTRSTWGEEKNPPAGFWIVGDHGVYLMHNGKIAEGEESVVAYAVECNPETCDDWWEVKRSTFGGDNGVDFVEMELIKDALDQDGWLEFEFASDSMMIQTVWNRRVMH